MGPVLSKTLSIHNQKYSIISPSFGSTDSSFMFDYQMMNDF